MTFEYRLMLQKITQVEEKFGLDVIENFCTPPDGSALNYKQMRVIENSDSRELPFFIQWLTADHP